MGKREREKAQAAAAEAAAAAGPEAAAAAAKFADITEMAGGGGVGRLHLQCMWWLVLLNGPMLMRLARTRKACFHAVD
jgi:hypothetical protein